MTASTRPGVAVRDGPSRGGPSLQSLGWLVALACVAAGCAPTRLPSPVAITCQALHLSPVTSPESRVEFPAWGYSILPPRGANWCVGGLAERGTIFNTHPLLGKLIDEKPERNDILHTFGLMTTADDVPKDAKFDTPEEMFAFIERRFLHPEPRFTVVQSAFRRDSSPGAECVRFDAVVEERNNPDARGRVFVGILRDNLLCRRPSAPTPTLVLISASERYVQGTVTGPLLIDALRSEWEPSVRSLRFQPRPCRGWRLRLPDPRRGPGPPRSAPPCSRPRDGPRRRGAAGGAPPRRSSPSRGDQTLRTEELQRAERIWRPGPPSC